VPAELIAGDTWEWTRNLSDYPAATWSAVWYFEKSDHNFSVTGGTSGDTHTATVAAATSAGHKPGEYRWRLVMTASGVRKTAESGYLDVLRDPAAVGNADHRSIARVMLDNVEAYLRDPTNLAAASYSLGGRSLSRWSRSELLTERSRLQAEVMRETQADRLSSGVGVPRLQVRF
jgi:hypothetical protein